MAEAKQRTLDTDADQALFTGDLQGLVVTCYENERPPCGLLGLMDWRFHGRLSQSISAGAITGKEGEFIYFPISRNHELYHLILVGAGTSPSPGKREPLRAEVLKSLQRNLTSLKLQRIGISQADFGGVREDYFEKYLKGVPLWIVA